MQRMEIEFFSQHQQCSSLALLALTSITNVPGIVLSSQEPNMPPVQSSGPGLLICVGAAKSDVSPLICHLISAPQAVQYP